MDDIRAPGVLDSDAALVRLALDGDEVAFARIVRLHRATMVRASLVVTLDLDLALEAVGAAWPVAWDRLGTLRDPSRLGPWLCSVAVHEAREIVVHGSSRLDLGSPVEAAAPGAGPDDVALARDPELVQGLAGLDVEDRVLLALCHVAGSSPGELGRATMTAPRAAQARVIEAGLLLAPGAGERIGSRLRAFADVPVGHVQIDAVARDAKITRHDRRNRLLSLALAAALAAPIVVFPYLGQSGALSAALAAAAPPPVPGLDAAPRNLARPR